VEGSEHQVRKLARTVASGALLALVIAASGCGGGGSDKSAAPAAPVNAKPSAGGGLVSAEGTEGLVGPAQRATDQSSSGSDASSRISPKANQKTGAQKHGVAAGAACDNSGMTPSADNLSQVNAVILCLVNAERADAGLPALADNPQLRKAAEGMAARMVSEQFFSHTTPDGKNVVDRVEPTGYIPGSGDWVVGENLAWGSGALSTPQAIVNGWMNSPGHKANILATDYKDVGLAVALGSPSPSQSGGTTYVNNFGARSGANINASLPGEGGASGGDGSDQATAATTASAKKATKKSKKKKRRKRRRRH
jgi:uncharacterized protein YkwD